MNRFFLLACIAALSTNITMRMLDSNLASFASEAWSSKELGGYLTSMFNVGSIAMAFFAGRLVDTKVRRNCLMASTFLFGLATLLIVFWPTPAVTLTVRLIQGMGKSVATVALASTISDVVPRERMNEGMGIYNLGNTISFAFGPMLGLALVSAGGYTFIFLAAGCFYGAGNAVVMPERGACAVVDSPAPRSGVANSTFYFMMDFGILFASAVFGKLLDAIPDAATGYTMMYVIRAGFCVFSLLYSVLFFNNKARARRREKAGVVI